jgi:glycosyltransferase involved in cell wall biosynthesis
VLTVHDLFPLERPEWFSLRERWSCRRGLAVALRRARRVIVPSEWVAERVMARFELDRARIAVVPHGVSAAFAPGRARAAAGVCERFGLTPGAYAVSVGTVTTRKNLVPVVRAAPQLARHGLALVLVGPDGHGADQVDAELQRVGVSDAETAELVRSAAVAVHPALAEGFGLVPLEAMAAGTPVVAGRAASIPEVVGQAAVLVEDLGDPGEWAAAVLAAGLQEPRRTELVAAGRRRAAGFSWQEAARRTWAVYREAADG